MLRWHVAQAVRNREVAAALSVTEFGMKAYVPSTKRRCKRGFQIVEEAVPRFGTYVFLQFDREKDQWGKLVGDHATRRRYFERILCGSDGLPSVVPNQAIEAIRAYVPPPSREPLMPYVYSPGERITCFIAGVRREAVFVEYCGSRPFIRTWIFGAERVTEVSTSELEPLDLDVSQPLSLEAG